MIISGNAGTRSYVRARMDDYEPRLYIVSGQSNATGVGLVSSLPNKPYDLSQPQPSVKWRYWYNSGSFSSELADFAPVGLQHGLEPSLVYRLSQHGRTSDVIVNTSWGGKDITHWAAGGDIYTQLINSVNESLIASGINEAHTLIWWQGEQDATDLALANAYEVSLADMISRLRVDISSPNLRVIIMKLNNLSTLTYASTVRTAQEAVATADPLVDLLDIDDLEPAASDYVHYTSKSYVTAGERVAERILQSSHYNAVSGLVAAWIATGPDDKPVSSMTNTGWHTETTSSHDAVQGTSSLQPVLIDAELKFTNSEYLLANPVSFGLDGSPPTEQTMIAVCSGQGTVVGANKGASASTAPYVRLIRTATGVEYRVRDVDVLTEAVATASGTGEIVLGWWDGSSAHIEIDDNSGAVSATITDLGSFSKLAVGGWLDGAAVLQDSLTGTVRAIFILTRAISQQDKARIRAWAASSLGVSS